MDFEHKFCTMTSDPVSGTRKSVLLQPTQIDKVSCIKQSNSRLIILTPLMSVTGGGVVQAKEVINLENPPRSTHDLIYNNVLCLLFSIVVDT